VAFNSLEFFGFLSVTYLLYRCLPLRGQNLLLLLASYLFYSWVDWRLVILLVIATTIAFYCGAQIGQLDPDAAKPRRFFLWLGVGASLGILGFFKYCNFFVDSVAGLLHRIGVVIELPHLNLMLVAGISFYIFKSISYLVDVYQQKLKASDQWIEFSLFLAFFPSLLAGPIDRATELLPQLAQPRILAIEQSAQGIFLILLGLFKKVAIADGIAGSVNGIYQRASGVTWADVVLSTILYTIQIYCDFSGYSDIAIGVAKLFGIELTLNFNLPYFSKNPREFWQRWHISLSTWLRDYLYIPLGGNRQGTLATYRNLMITMGLGGLWHGAAWNYVLWGLYQGVLLCFYRLIPFPAKGLKAGWVLRFAGGVLATLFFFAITCYGWLLFRATSLEQAIGFSQILLTDFGNFTLTMPKLQLSASWGLPVLIGYEIYLFTTHRLQLNYQLPIPVRAAFYAGLIFILVMGQSNEPAQYIYTQF
jgi:alginate O-acetyltransferase complex protein AlgI